MAKKPQALGAYVFGGGFTEGVRRHFDVLAHFEDDGYGVRTARANFPKMPIFVGPDSWPRKDYRGVPFVYGNPPCAAWSALNGKRTQAEQSWEQDARVDCTRRHFGLLEDLRPTVWVWESVDRAFTTGRPFVDGLAARAVALGYSVTHLRFDAQYVGGSHRRVRYFMIAHKVAFDWDRWVKFKEAPTTGEVLASVQCKTDEDSRKPVMNENLKKIYRYTRPGEKLYNAFNRKNPEHTRKTRAASTGRKFVVGRPGFKWQRLAADRVCPCLVGCTAFHPTEVRHVNFAEFKALCGYPRRWRVLPTSERASDIDWDVMTRAVMPPIANWIGGLVRKAIDQDKRLRRPRVEVIDLRKATIQREELS